MAVGNSSSKKIVVVLLLLMMYHVGEKSTNLFFSDIFFIKSAKEKHLFNYMKELMFNYMTFNREIRYVASTE